MSNQGNIEVWAWAPNLTTKDSGCYRFTTSRWGGDMTPAAVRRALRECYDKHKDADHAWNPHDFLGALAHDPDVGHLIPDFGNTDTPTVVVNFATQAVTFRREWDAKSSRRLWWWSFSDFVKLDFSKDPVVAKWYENLYHLAGTYDMNEHQCGRCGCHLKG
jgi:hypothetical protein